MMTITYNEEQTIYGGGLEIEAMAAWKWILQNNNKT
jgi:hypothetical protein